ncbi:MAG TPA: VOC family protein [Kofleriaceae bacterium]|nr:VOC family protein [Kofleriaceae bacterium]
MRLDHLVLWAEDPLKTVEWFERVVGLTAVRLDEFKAKQVMFPSVRVSDDTIIDIMPKAAAPVVNAIPGAKGTAGHPTNHVCLAMSEAEYHALAKRLEESGAPAGRFMENQYGARGHAPKAFYFRDPDGNILEARYY